MLTRLTARLFRTGSTPEHAAAAMVAASLVGVLTIAADRVDPNLVLITPLLLVASLFFIFNPRIEWSLVALMLYLGLLDGYIKLSTGNDLATLGRDVLLYSIVIGALMRS